MAFRKGIVAVDFDGTIVTHEFPKIGTPIPGARKTLEILKKRGHQVFLWTMRGAENVDRIDYLTPAVEFLGDLGIDLDGINDSPAKFSDSPKQHANIYIDDAALGCPKKLYQVAGNNTTFIAVDWRTVATYLQNAGFITSSDMLEIWQDIEIQTKTLPTGATIID